MSQIAVAQDVTQDAAALNYEQWSEQQNNSNSNNNSKKKKSNRTKTTTTTTTTTNNNNNTTNNNELTAIQNRVNTTMSSMMAKLRLHAEEKKSLTATITSLSSQVQSLQSSLQSRISEVDSLKQSVSELESNNSTLQSDNASLILEVERNNLLIQELDDEATSALSTPPSPHSLSSLHSQISELKSSLNASLTQHSLCRASLESQSRQRESLSDSNIILTADLKKARAEIERIKKGGEVERMEAVNRNLNKGFYVREMAMREVRTTFREG